MRGHNKPAIEAEILTTKAEILNTQNMESMGITPRLAAIGRAAMKDAGVILMKEAEWNAADDAITEMYDALLAAKVFLESMQMIAPFHPEMNRLTDKLKDVNEEIETALCACERYQEEAHEHHLQENAK